MRPTSRLAGTLALRRKGCASVTGLARNVGVILGAMFAPAGYGEIDPFALLNLAQSGPRENRREYQEIAKVHVRPDGAPLQVRRDTRCPRERLRLSAGSGNRAATGAGVDRPVQIGCDRFRSRGDLCLGGQRFQSEEVDKIVGGGMTGSGDFGPAVSRYQV